MFWPLSWVNSTIKSQTAGCARKNRSNSCTICSSVYSPTSLQAFSTASPLIIESSILAQRVHAGKRVLMRKLLGPLVPLFALSGAFLLGQVEVDFEGNYSDFLKLPAQPPQKHDF